MAFRHFCRRMKGRWKSCSYRPLLMILEDRTVPGFLAPLSFDAGTGPQAVAVADFNGDGIADLALADGGDYRGSDAGVSVLLGNGDGTFQAPRTFTAGSKPSAVAVGDFNGDGVPDLAVANYDSGNVSILLGNGDGSFQPARNYAVGDHLESVAVGDFTGNGILDLAVAYSGSFPRTGGGVSVLLGNGDGTFQPAQTVDTGYEASSVVVGDFTGDGILGLGTTVSFGTNVFVGYVYLGNGDGSFRRGSAFDPGSVPYSVTAGDFTGDGIQDLAVATYDSGTVTVVLGNGDGSFQPARSYAAGPNPASVAVGDFNGDGTPDLTVANDSGDTVSVLLGNGDGSFQPARSFTSGYAPRSVAVGDFNGDGSVDLAVANYGGNTVSVLPGNGDGSFQAAPIFATGSQPSSVAVGDFNGDGIPDLAMAYGASPEARESGVSVLLDNGDGTFQPAVNYATGRYSDSVVVGDFNGDGIPDLAVANKFSSTVSVLLGNGDGTFQDARSFAVGYSPWSMAVGNFNGDGIPDLAVANGDDVSVLFGNGDGTFQAARTFPAGGGPVAVAVGDFNGDGIPDLAVADDYGGVTVLLGNGDGSFQPPHVFATVAGLRLITAQDFTGDGIPDLAVVSGSGVSVLLGNGDGTFQPARTFAAGSYPASVAVGDFNGDGVPDLVVVGRSGTRILRGDGDGSFQTTNVSYVTGNATSVAVGNFDGDGLPDLAVTDSGVGVTILDNDGLWPARPDGAPRHQVPTRHAGIALGPKGAMERVQHPCEALCAGGLGGQRDRGAESTLTAAHREPVGQGTEAVRTAGDMDLAPMVSVAGDRFPVRLGPDMLFSGLGRDEADSSFQGEASAGPLDWARESALTWTGGLPFERDPMTVLP